MTTAPLVLIDGMIGFRISEGMVTLNLSCIRGEWISGATGAESRMGTFVQPAVDLVMPIPALMRIIQAIQTHLAEAEAKANLVPHPTQQ